MVNGWIEKRFTEGWKSGSVDGWMDQSMFKKFGFINGVDNVNWPPYRDSKS